MITVEKVVTKDSLLGLGESTSQELILDTIMDGINVRYEHESNLLHRTRMFRSPRMIQKLRSTNSIIDILSKIGGLKTIAQSQFGLIISFINEYIFTLIVIKRMFFAKTNDDHLFSTKTKKQVP